MHVRAMRTLLLCSYIFFCLSIEIFALLSDFHFYFHRRWINTRIAHECEKLYAHRISFASSISHQRYLFQAMWLLLLSPSPESFFSLVRIQLIWHGIWQYRVHIAYLRLMSDEYSNCVRLGQCCTCDRWRENRHCLNAMLLYAVCHHE